MTAAIDLKWAYPRVRVAVEAFADWIRHLEEATHDSLAALDERDVAAIAHDLGMTAHELRDVAAKGGHSAQQLFERMAALHLDADAVAKANPETMWDMQRVCSFCGVRGRCRRDLAYRPGDTAWKSYCPNATTLESLEHQA
jgi:hypothetical protein